MTVELVHYVMHLTNYNYIAMQGLKDHIFQSSPRPQRPIENIIEDFIIDRVTHRDISEVILPKGWRISRGGDFYLGFKFFDRYEANPPGEAITPDGEKLKGRGRIREISQMHYVGDLITVEKALEDKDISELTRRILSRPHPDARLVKLAGIDHEYYFVSENDIIVPENKLRSSE